MPRTVLTGKVLDDRYRVLEPIGEGAMGSVYRGERLKLGRFVAIKVLNEEIPNEAQRRRFEREAMAMAKLEHPHCASVLDVGIHDDQPYVVMELVSGQNLKQLLAETGALPIARAVEITRQVLSGLAHAHEHGIIHRDVKPANIVLSQKSGMGDFVKILDFGLARFKQDNSNLTGAMVVGTPNYMAPEQIKGSTIDHRVDLYACGVLLFELVTGTKPFEAKDPVAVCMLHVNQPPPRLADRAPRRAFGALEDIVARALEKNPDDRFATAEEFSRALAELSVPAPAAPAPVPARPKQTSKRTVVLAGGLVIAAGAAGAVVLASRKPVAPPAARASVPAPAVAAARPDEAPKKKTTDDAVDAILARAKDAAGAGRREAALDQLLDARKTYPKDARLAYEASKLYLDKMWWADGLKQARAAIALDAAYKKDPDLIKLVLKGFNTTKNYDGALARFLREDIGPAARPYLEDTAQNHPNPIVRSRAKAELKRY